MPIYGYRCEQCGHELEVLQSMSEERLRVCPNCMGPLRKMIYPVGIVFKGSGYYTTDYKSPGSASRHGDSDAAASASASSDGGSETAKSSSGGEQKNESKTESKSESKSESKAESKAESKPSKEASRPSSSAKPAAK